MSSPLRDLVGRNARRRRKNSGFAKPRLLSLEDRIAPTTFVVANAGRGAGIFVGNENVTIRDCVISGNTTIGQDGAGIFVFAYGQLTLINSTVSGNTTNPSTDGDGGGIAGSYYAELNILNSTVS